MEEKNTTKRIAKNTLMLYFRQILIMIVSLYTVRVVLNTLGAEDYGIYNVVAGVVTMFSFISGSMSTACQRYFSFDIGKNDEEHLKVTFSLTVTIYFLIAIIVVLLAETIGLWFLLKKLVIPLERVSAAHWVYHFSVISFFFTIIAAPFTADIIAHENMNIYAYVSIVEVGLKPLVAFLVNLCSTDSLIFYGFLMLFFNIILTTIYCVICKIKYKECKYKFCWDKAYVKELFSFTGWNLFGAASGVLKNQMINVLLNQYFNPIVITAKSVSMQVRNAVSSFSLNFSLALHPQIIKTYSAGEYEDSLKHTFSGSKFTYYLMWIFTLPLVLEMKGVLTLWLKEPPAYAVIFTQLALIDVLVESLGFPLMTLAQATGKIKLYQSVVGGIQLLNFPFCWIILYLKFPVWSVQLIGILVTFIAMIARLLILRKITKFSIVYFLKTVIVPCICVTFVTFFIGIVISKFSHFNVYFVLINIIVEFFLVIVAIYFLGLNKNEKIYIIMFLKKKLHINF